MSEPECKNLQIRSFFIVLEKNNRITEYSAQIKSKSGFASEFGPQLTQKSSKSKIAMGLTLNDTECIKTKQLIHTVQSRIEKTCK